MEIYLPLSNQRDDFTGRRITKRQTAPLILDALEKRDDYADIVGKIIAIAAGWETFELSGNEYQARAVKAKAQEILKWFRQVGPVWQPAEDEVAVSGIGTIAAARVTPRDGSIEPFIAVSMYARWIGSHPSVKTAWSFGYADSSVHQIISDLSAFIGHENPQTHRILAAGDLNIAHGYGDGGDPYWEARYRTVFERMAATGLEFMGPQAPHGRQAETPATGEPADSRNVVTYYLPGKNPETASNNQLDYVFASRGFHEDITVRAMNSVEEWGASDHCRLLIKIADGITPPSTPNPESTEGRRVGGLLKKQKGAPLNLG